MDVPIGLCWGSLEGAPLETLAQAAAATGVTSITATPAMVFDARERCGSVGAVAALLDRCGVRVEMIDPLLRGLPGALDAAAVGPRWRATFLHDEEDCHRAAEIVGAATINVAHFLGAPTPRAALVDAIGAITERAARQGRRIAIEAMPEGAIADVAEAAAIAAAVAHRSCGITIDTWHWWRSGGDLAEVHALAAGSVFAVQIADAASANRGSGTAPPARDRLVPGAGDLPLAELARSLRAAHPAAWFGLEVFDRTRQGDAPESPALDAVTAWRNLGA